MALILNIDTAIDNASICLGDNGKLLAFDENSVMGEQAAWLHTAIKKLLQQQNLQLSQLDAIAISNGPGSYTGLRIGLATAKGLCYALGIPLLCLSTLTIIANAVRHEAEDYICAAIDARRMEVFTSIYDRQLKMIMPPTALVINETSFIETLTQHSLLFAGNGAIKIKQTVGHHYNTNYNNQKHNAAHMLLLSQQMFDNKEFSNISYVEPFYIKETHFNKI